MRSFKIYDFTLSAGGSMPLLVEGGYFKIYSCTGVLSVSIDGGSSIGPINTGQGMKTEFKRLTIVDQSGAANVGKIIVASNEFVDGRISGSVTVIDSNRDIVIAGQAMSASVNLAASVANLNIIELWNPAGSAKILDVDKVTATIQSPGAAGQLWVQESDTQMATFVAASTSMYLTGANGVSQARYTQAAAVPGVLGSVFGTLVFPIANTATFYGEFKRPILVPPNRGLLVYLTVVNIALQAQFQFVERPA